MSTESSGPSQQSGSEIGRPRLLQRVHEAIRVRHYSRRTEEAYVHWHALTGQRFTGSDPVSGGSVIVDCLGGLGGLGGLGVLGGSIIFLGSLGVSAVQLLVFLFVSFVSFVVQLLILSV